MQNKPIGLQHFGLPVRNMDTSVAFYRGLGFEPVALKYGLNGYNVAMIKNGDCVIEVYECLAEGKNHIDERKLGKWDHIALLSENIEAAFQEMVNAGFAIQTDGIESTTIWPSGGKYFIILGPDGERIEFHQVF